MNETLKLSNLTKKYYNKIALQNVNLTFERGKIYGLLGPNGSGKTTLMKIIAGLHKQTSGEILINDKPLSYETKAFVSYLPTDNFLYDSFKVKDIIKFYSDMYSDFNKDFALEVLQNNVDTELKVSKLSSGMIGKLKVALSLSRNADIYLLDEPLNGVDVLARDAIMDLIVKAYNENKVIIISSHLVSETEKIFDSAIFLKDGNIELNGDAEELRQKYGKSIENIYKEIYNHA